jgi:Ankyrin repeats (many copies)
MDSVDDSQWRDALQGLLRGDFSRLEPLFTPDYTESGERPRIIKWYEEGSFENEVQALAESFSCACFLGRTGIADFLLTKGVDPSAGTGTGLSGFHWAANRGNLETVNMLIERKAPLEQLNSYGGTVLDCTLWSAFNEPHADHLRIIEALLAAGARVEPDWQPHIEELRRRASF